MSSYKTKKIHVLNCNSSNSRWTQKHDYFFHDAMNKRACIVTEHYLMGAHLKVFPCYQSRFTFWFNVPIGQSNASWHCVKHFSEQSLMLFYMGTVV